ncbi:hypothetical protein I5907_02220 [Panacibacter sp. DH6]|uniref:CobW/HypB/UreG nucleotide-binding domain-containing protein n=1 Tax=Panacibacter microcysteis TaxID=2793269 RepID=A0A931GYA2_9BACT|nr:GTP-binding protein [Panacibacter microcysteis]MBG9375027.1 hypothetical protein [Panacibacter microcysteis]
MGTLQIYLVGGFLGSGKTTAIAAAALQLQSQHIKTGVVTNDQGNHLVDKALMNSLHIENADVPNGCFCCNYNNLTGALLHMQTNENVQVVFAESVGSCTDLIATVVKPMIRHYPDFRIVLSVFVDAGLLKAIVYNEASFVSEDVRYIYGKQIEEADLLIMNKWDTLSASEKNDLGLFIQSNLAHKKILYQNSASMADVAAWLRVLQEYPALTDQPSLAIDYDRYASGEALLAWSDCLLSIHTMQPVAVAVARLLMDTIAENIKAQHYAIGHLKFFLHNEAGWSAKVSYTTREHNLKAGLTNVACKHLEVMINARVETDPAVLSNIIHASIEQVIAGTGSRIIVQTHNSFKPGYPKPTQRID